MEWSASMISGIIRKNNDDCINLNKESSEDIFVKIEKLSKLKDMGAINEDEFNEAELYQREDIIYNSYERKICPESGRGRACPICHV